MSISWSREVLERSIAPEITSFTDAEIPDLRQEIPEGAHWLGNHFLNSILRQSFVGMTRQFAVNYIFRASNAFRLYHEARDLTASFLDGANPYAPKLSKYFCAVSAWESFLINVSISVDMLSRLGKVSVFSRGDGTAIERAYVFANQVKHFAQVLTRGEAGDAQTLPIWLTSRGLSSVEGNFAYSEAAETMRDLAEVAQFLQDPVQVVKG